MRDHETARLIQSGLFPESRWLLKS
jgi:hypothetical protein